MSETFQFFMEIAVALALVALLVAAIRIEVSQGRRPDKGERPRRRPF
jgi:hypothetical protein